MAFNTKSPYYIAIGFILTHVIGGIEITSAQQLSPSEEFEKYSKLYPNDNGVVINDWQEYEISIVDDSLSIIIKDYEETLILSNPLGWIKDKVYTSSFREVTDIEAYTLVPGKRKYKKVLVEDFKRSYDKDTYVFFDDTEQVSYSYPEVSTGCKIVTKTRYRLHNPYMIGQYFFSSYRPVLKAQIRIVTDNNIFLKHGLFNKELVNIKFETNELDDNKKEYIYSAINLDKIVNETNNPSFNYLSPSLYMTISHYLLDDAHVQILSSIEDLHLWYNDFIKDKTIDESVRSLAKSIVSEEDGDYDKIRKIFYWVQANVKYIAFEEGMRGFIPHNSGYVLKKRYGDCKDMSSLLVGLLRSQDITANYTWVGTRDLPYKYSETPSPIIDNHMIASVEHEGETIFLDATGGYIPLGFPTSMIQGKESLISKDNKPKIVEVPVVPKDQNLMIDTSYVYLNEGIIEGKAKLVLSGLVKVANTYKLIDRTSQGEEDYLKKLLSKGSNKFYLDEYKVYNLENLDKQIEIAYDFRIDDYYKSIGDNIYINLCLDKSLSNDLIIDRVTPIENDYKYISKSTTVLEVPKDYNISYLPDDSSFNSDHFGYSISYEQSNDKLYTTKELYVDYLLMYPKDFENWNEAIKEYAQAVRTTVVLTKNNN